MEFDVSDIIDILLEAKNNAKREIISYMNSLGKDDYWEYFREYNIKEVGMYKGIEIAMRNISMLLKQEGLIDSSEAKALESRIK